MVRGFAPPQILDRGAIAVLMKNIGTHDDPSDRRLPIYALLGVPEVWRYDGYSLEFLALEHGEYQPIEKSLSFPDLPSAIIVEFVALNIFASNATFHLAKVIFRKHFVL